MATLRITNQTPNPVYVNDLYTTIPGSGVALPQVPYVDVERSLSEISAMRGVQTLAAEGVLLVDVTYSDVEKDAFDAATRNSLAALAVPNTYPTANASTLLAPALNSRTALTASGASGVLVETAANGLGPIPAPNARIIDAYAFITVAGPGTLELRYTPLDGSPTTIATLDATATGRVELTTLPTTLLALNSRLFIRRDRSVTAQVFITVRLEA